MLQACFPRDYYYSISDLIGPKSDMDTFSSI